MSNLETALCFQLDAMKIDYVREYKFCRHLIGDGPGFRKRLKAAGLKDWRFDIAFPKIKFAVEVEGIIPGKGGRHQRIGGFKEDILKYHNAMDQGWTVYRCTGELIKNGQALQIIEKLIKAHE